ARQRAGAPARGRAVRARPRPLRAPLGRRGARVHGEARAAARYLRPRRRRVRTARLHAHRPLANRRGAAPREPRSVQQPGNARALRDADRQRRAHDRGAPRRRGARDSRPEERRAHHRHARARDPAQAPRRRGARAGRARRPLSADALPDHRRGAGAPRTRAACRAARRGRAARLGRTARPRGRAQRALALPRDGHAQRGRGLRGRVRGGDGLRRAGDRLPGRERPRGDRRAGRGDAAGTAEGPRRARRHGDEGARGRRRPRRRRTRDRGRELLLGALRTGHGGRLRARHRRGPEVKPAALITNRVSDYRREPFELLAGEANVKVIAWDEGRLTQLGAVREAASGRYRAVICGLGGRIALPGSYAAARRRRIPFVLWASIWGHPRTAAHALSYLPTRHLYRHADAVVTYGPHVSEYVEARRGGRGNVIEAPQAVSAEEFGNEIAPELRRHARMHAGAPGEGGFLALFVGRLVREKGVRVLLDAWRRADLGEGSVLALAGEGPLRAEVERAGPDVEALGFVPRDHLPSLYAAADVLVLPSIRTETFLEPWGLVVNEAMHQGT